MWIFKNVQCEWLSKENGGTERPNYFFINGRKYCIRLQSSNEERKIICEEKEVNKEVCFD